MSTIQNRIVLFPDANKQDDTKRIQEAVDRGSLEKKWVVLEAGQFHVGTICLREHSKVELREGCEIIGSDDLRKYTVHEYCHQSQKNYWQSIFYGKNIAHVVLKGPGKILGQGDKFPFGLEAFSADDWQEAPVQEFKVRPSLLYFKACSDIEVDGIQLKDAAQFAVLVEECEKILFKNVYVHNRKNRNTDGFHFSWNRNITIQSCKLDCGDDASVLNRNAVNVEIKDCDISSRWAGIRIGPFSDGEFSNIEVSDCLIHDTYGCAVKIQIGQGGTAHGIRIHHVEMENVTGPVHINLSHIPSWELQGSTGVYPGSISDIEIEHIHAKVAAEPKPLPHEVPVFEGERFSCVNVQGLSDYKLGTLRFANWEIEYEGGYHNEEYALNFTEDVDYRYPEYFLFGIMPCYAFYAAYIDALELEQIAFSVKKQDVRVPMIIHNINRTKFVQVCIEGEQFRQA